MLVMFREQQEIQYTRAQYARERVLGDEDRDQRQKAVYVRF